MNHHTRTPRPRSDSGASEDLALPPKKIRCGDARYREDDFYVRSGEATVRLLDKLCGITEEARVLDIGCGCGRLLTGILSTLGGIREYVGIDVDRQAINWAKRRLEDPELGIRFERIDVLNERYNPKGSSIRSDRILPLGDGRFDRVVLLSVFSHMRLGDIRRYLEEIRRVLAPGGRVFLSLFAEYGVPAEEENPEGYQRSWSGRLHCVRLHRHRFEEHVYAAGLEVDYFRHRHTPDGQSTYVLSNAGSKAPSGS
jgi:SAM-dependent methyltransferase